MEAIPAENVKVVKNLNDVLIRALENLHPVNDGLKQFLQQHAFSGRYGNGKFISAPFTHSGCHVFICSGYARLFTKSEGIEYTRKLIGPDTFNMNMGNEQNLYLQAIGNVQAILFNAHDFDDFCFADPSATYLSKLLHDLECNSMEQNDKLRRVNPPVRRLLMLKELQPDVEGKLPLKYVADLLGMMPETLFRVKKLLKNAN